MGAGETDGAEEGVFVSCNGLSMVFGSVLRSDPVSVTFVSVERRRVTSAQ